MRGLDPRIHLLRKTLSRVMDCRVKPGNDELDASLRAKRSNPVRDKGWIASSLRSSQ
jgi:hypothetical protein